VVHSTLVSDGVMITINNCDTVVYKLCLYRTSVLLYCVRDTTQWYIILLFQYIYLVMYSCIILLPIAAFLKAFFFRGNLIINYTFYFIYSYFHLWSIFKMHTGKSRFYTLLFDWFVNVNVHYTSTPLCIICYVYL